MASLPVMGRHGLERAALQRFGDTQTDRQIVESFTPVKRYHKIAAPLDDITVRFDITPERYSAQVVTTLPTEKESVAAPPPRVEPPGAMSFRAAAARVRTEHGPDLPTAEAIERMRALGVRGRNGAEPKPDSLKSAWREAKRTNTPNEHGEHEHPTGP